MRVCNVLPCPHVMEVFISGYLGSPRDLHVREVEELLELSRQSNQFSRLLDNSTWKS